MTAVSNPVEKRPRRLANEAGNENRDATYELRLLRLCNENRLSSVYPRTLLRV